MNFDEAVAYNYRYDPETGKFYNKRGKEVGSYTRVYGRIEFRKKHITLSRLAVFLMKGYWPEGEVDHENLNTHDDRWDNLREATRTQNAQNKGVRHTNKTGYKGVHNNGWSFVASIQTNKKRKYLGSFKTLEEAVAAYNEAAIKHHKEFAKLNEGIMI